MRCGASCTASTSSTRRTSALTVPCLRRCSVAPAQASDAHILLLAPELLERLHASEPNYRFAALEDLSATLDGGAEVVVDGAYVSRHGCLARERSELALAAVGARGRRLPAAPERVALTHARDRAAPGLALETFVARAVAEPAVRSRWTATLRAEAIALRRATA